MNVEDERAKFESWAKGEGFATALKNKNAEFVRPGEYDTYDTSCAWEGWLARAEAEGEMVSVPTWHLLQLRAAFNSLSGHVLHITGGAFYDSNGVDIRCSPWTELASTADWLGRAIERLPAHRRRMGNERA